MCSCGKRQRLQTYLHRHPSAACPRLPSGKSGPSELKHSKHPHRLAFSEMEPVTSSPAEGCRGPPRQSTTTIHSPRKRGPRRSRGGLLAAVPYREDLYPHLVPVRLLPRHLCTGTLLPGVQAPIPVPGTCTSNHQPGVGRGRTDIEP